MYISIEWGLMKIVSILFGLFVIFVGLYPFIQGNFVGFPYLEDRLLHSIIIFIGILQVLLSVKSHRPKID